MANPEDLGFVPPPPPEPAPENQPSDPSEGLQQRDLKIGRLVYEGPVARVFQAVHKDDPEQQYAVKVYRVEDVVRLNKTETVKKEVSILRGLHAVGIPSINAHYQDPHRLFVVMELVDGPKLFDFVLRHCSACSPFCVKFYAAELILVLEELYKKGVVYRDSFYENCYLTSSGHLRLLGFTEADMVQPDQSTAESFKGGVDFLPPEALKKQGISHSSHLWELGLFIYHLLAGSPPFQSDKSTETFQKIMKGEFRVPDHFPSEATDLVRKLLTQSPQARLGHGGAFDELKAHPFFREIRWDSLEEIPPPPPSEMESADVDSVRLSTDSQREEGALAIPLEERIHMILSGTVDSETREAWLSQQRRMQWSKFLYPNELALHVGLFVKKGKRRQLLLTDFPRILYIDPAKMTVQNALEWHEILGVEMNRAGHLLLRIEVKKKKLLQFEPLGGDTREWVNAITALKTKRLNNDRGPSVQLSTILQNKEDVVHTALVNKYKKIGGSQLRQLVLTNYPRLLYIEPSTMIVKGEIPFTNDIVAEPHKKDETKFLVTSADRTWEFEDISNEAKRWVNAIIRMKEQKLSGGVDERKKFLFAGEDIIHSGDVLKSAPKLGASKKRHLVLTNWPRVFYYDPERMEFKGEIDWSSELSVEVKDKSKFIIKTPKRAYQFEDVGGDAPLWEATVNDQRSNSKRFGAKELMRKYLYANEHIFHTTSVIKRKSIGKDRRQLILTDFPRIFYVDNSKGVLKGEIRLTEHVTPEVVSDTRFKLHTADRIYTFDDEAGDANKWVEAIMAVKSKVSKDSDELRKRFLYPGEDIIMSNIVLRRHGDKTANKKRALVLTNQPRLFFINPVKMKYKGEIQWEEDKAPELLTVNVFVIHSTKGDITVQDTIKPAQEWVDALSAMPILAWQKKVERASQ